MNRGLQMNLSYHGYHITILLIYSHSNIIEFWSKFNLTNSEWSSFDRIKSYYILPTIDCATTTEESTFQSMCGGNGVRILQVSIISTQSLIIYYLRLQLSSEPFLHNNYCIACRVVLPLLERDELDILQLTNPWSHAVHTPSTLLLSDIIAKKRNTARPYRDAERKTWCPRFV